MKKFVIKIIGLLILLLILLIVFDFSYTIIYENSIPRTKFQYLRSLKNTKVNYVFLGSSRVDNGIDPLLIEKSTHKESINLGYQASKLGDVYTTLQLLKNYNIACDTVFIQIDYNFVTNGHSINLPYEITPFVKDNETTKYYFLDYIKKHPSLYYIPFLRYIWSDQKNGIREIFANIIGKKTKIVQNKGFNPLQGFENRDEAHRSLPSALLLRNSYFEKIKTYGIKNNIKIIFFCAPFCKHIKNKNYLTKLKIKIPDLYDFSNAIQNDSMFVNCFHLNESGAKKFTEIFVNDVLNNSKQ